MFIWLLIRVTLTVNSALNLFINKAITAILKILLRYLKVIGEDIKELYYKQA